MIRILEFADVINRSDFIDTIVQFADPAEFEVSVCVRSEEHNIAKPEFSPKTKYKFLAGNSRRDAVRTAWKLSRLLKEWKIDILHAHHFEQAVVGWMATRFCRSSKLVIGRHYSDSIYRQQSKYKKKGLLAVEQIINKAAKRIIVPSVYILNILKDQQGVDPKKVDVVLYGFDPKKYSSISDQNVKLVQEGLGMEDRIVFGNFSRLHEEKGHRYLVEAAKGVVAEIPNALVLIVGEGNERAALEKQIETNDLCNTVKLLGWRKDAMEIMSACDVVVQSTLQEAFSQVMCEALWLQKPLIISDVSGAVDIINEATGVMVPKGDAHALSSAMIELAKDTEKRREIGENGSNFVNRELSIDKMIKEYEDSFRKAMS